MNLNLKSWDERKIYTLNFQEEQQQSRERTAADEGDNEQTHVEQVMEQVTFMQTWKYKWVADNVRPN